MAFSRMSFTSSAWALTALSNFAYRTKLILIENYHHQPSIE